MSADTQIRFTDHERATIRAAASQIVPASDDGRLPAAGEYDVPGHIEDGAPRLLGTLREELTLLDQEAMARRARPFVELSFDEGVEVVTALRSSHPGFMRGLAKETVSFYYQQDRVLEAIGLEARSPYPQGFVVHSGDLSLLDPVRERGQVYRDVD